MTVPVMQCCTGETPVPRPVFARECGGPRESRAAPLRGSGEFLCRRPRVSLRCTLGYHCGTPMGVRVSVRRRRSQRGP